MSTNPLNPFATKPWTLRAAVVVALCGMAMGVDGAEKEGKTILSAEFASYEFNPQAVDVGTSIRFQGDRGLGVVGNGGLNQFARRSVMDVEFTVNGEQRGSDSRRFGFANESDESMGPSVVAGVEEEKAPGKVKRVVSKAKRRAMSLLCLLACRNARK